MERVLIVGAGGHAQVVADILLKMAAVGQPIQPIGYIDDNPAVEGLSFLGLPVIGTIAERARISHDALIIAIGDNQIRRRLAQELIAHGTRLASAIHPTAIIAGGVTIGPGATICARVVINPGATVGANVIVNTAGTIDHHNRIGDHVHIAPGVCTGGDVVIDEGAFVGIGATVMPQRRVGAWSVVGAGSLVQRDIPPGVVAFGVPAQIRRDRL